MFESGHGIHMPLKLGHLFHDESFWATSAALALILLFIAIAIWATVTGKQSPTHMPTPYYPYGF